jgi:hypothetical protein
MYCNVSSTFMSCVMVLPFGTVPLMPRPRNHLSQDATLSIRLYRTELEAVKKAAENAGKSIADYVRDRVVPKSKKAA